MTDQAHCPGNQPANDDAAVNPEKPYGQAVDGKARPLEIGGRSGPEPTRYGDWELRGRCIDF